MKPAVPALVLAFGCAIAAAASGQTPIAELGKQRAARSSLQWETGEAGHPLLGTIRFATLKTPVTTPAGATKVSSNIYVSCERSTRKIALELANGTRADDPDGLKPKAMPRLTCSTLDSAGKPAAEDIEARWTVNELGDAMARGFFPATLRACASIGIVEDLLLPPGSRPVTARVAFEISPYARELDTIFATCGEPTAYAGAPPAAEPSQPRTPVASQAPAAGASPASPWIVARVSSTGHTNVRAKADIRSAVVIKLDPGDVVLVQRSTDDWWPAMSRPTARAPFQGYIRRDRLVVK